MKTQISLETYGQEQRRVVKIPSFLIKSCKNHNLFLNIDKSNNGNGWAMG